MSLRRIRAVFKKQVLETWKNKAVLLQFLMFPVLGVILTKTIADGNKDIPYDYFITMFAAMYVGMSPAVAMEGIISEEKEKGTLRFLLMSNVKSHEYLFGVGLYVFIMCMLGSTILSVGGGYRGDEFLSFLLIMALGVICSMMFGATLGMISTDQMSSHSTTLPIVMVFAFMPMIAMFNKTFLKLSRFLYTQQVYDVINSKFSISSEGLIVLLINFALFLIIFVNLYRKKGLLDN